jgi:hypothetical protein
MRPPSAHDATTDHITRQQWAEIVAAVSGLPVRPGWRRRSRRRRLENGEARLRFTDPKTRQAIVRTVAVFEVGDGGMGVISHEPIANDTPLEIEVHLNQPLFLTGRVAHSTTTVGAHKVGIELDFSRPTSTPKTPRAAGAAPAAPSAPRLPNAMRPRIMRRPNPGGSGPSSGG